MDTRTQILEKNYYSIHTNGFQGTRTDKVIEELGITKGAFYHYFPTKLSMGYAVVDEIIYPMYVDPWRGLENSPLHTIDSIVSIIERIQTFCTDENVRYGCPLNNLIQEMSSLDEGFHQRLHRVVDAEVNLISKAVEKGQQKGEVSKEVASDDLAYFILAGIEGSYAIGKSKSSRTVFLKCMGQLVHYLKTLKR